MTPGRAAAFAAVLLMCPQVLLQAQPAPPESPPLTQPGAGGEEVAPPTPSLPQGWVAAGAAELSVLDKIDAVSRPVTVRVGQSAQVGSLTIAVQACDVRPPDQPPDATAFLVITDSHADEPGFRGWMLANEPWLSMLESPVYDVRLVGCQP